VPELDGARVVLVVRKVHLELVPHEQTLDAQASASAPQRSQQQLTERLRTCRENAILASLGCVYRTLISPLALLASQSLGSANDSLVPGVDSNPGQHEQHHQCISELRATAEDVPGTLFRA
jgi:hypothetical protein